MSLRPPGLLGIPYALPASFPAGPAALPLPQTIAGLHLSGIEVWSAGTLVYTPLPMTLPDGITAPLTIPVRPGFYEAVFATIEPGTTVSGVTLWYSQLNAWGQ